MKIKTVPAIIAFAISLLISYGLYNFHIGENKVLLSVGSFIFLAFTLIFAIGVSFELSRTAINIKVLSWFFFFIALASNLIFTFLLFFVPIYIVVNGILILIFLLIVYLLNKAKQ